MRWLLLARSEVAKGLELAFEVSTGTNITSIRLPRIDIFPEILARSILVFFAVPQREGATGRHPKRKEAEARIGKCGRACRWAACPYRVARGDTWHALTGVWLTGDGHQRKKRPF